VNEPENKHSHTSRSGAATLLKQRGVGRRGWSEKSMEGALKEVSEGELTIRRAALQYNVPKSTLHDQIVGKVIPGAKVGAPRYLDDEEELELVVRCSQYWVPKDCPGSEGYCGSHCGLQAGFGDRDC